MTSAQFIAKLADLLEPVMECDMLDQESLFEMQEGVCDLIAKGSNGNISVAKQFAKHWDQMFITTQVPVK